MRGGRIIDASMCCPVLCTDHLKRRDIETADDADVNTGVKLQDRGGVYAQR
jgi:hypothetical protein